MKKLGLTVAGVSLMGFSAFGAGFALYEGSASGTALGGAVMGKAVDASAVFYNPATMSDFTNTIVTLGLVTEHPTADTSINGRHGRKMDPGAFVLPHVYVVQPLPYDFSFGVGLAPEFGLGTHYNHDWEMAWNTQDTLVEGIVVNPNVSYRVTDKWSVAAGFRLLYFTFEQHSAPQTPIGPMSNHLKGNNGFSDWGWELSTRYKFTDSISAGILYKSYIDTSVRGSNHTSTGNPYLQQAALMNSGSAGADIRLPQSVTIGGNWDVTETVHLGTALTWTEWSSLDKIAFNLPGGTKTTQLNWNDVFRVGLGGSWDFHENFSLLGSYVYDIDPCSHRPNNGSTMLPPGDRHIATLGLQWHWGNFDLTVCYGLVFMTSHSAYYTDSFGQKWKFDTHDGLSHSAGVSVSYSF